MFGRKQTTDSRLIERVEMLEKMERDLVKMVQQLSDSLTELEDKHERLRGKVYAHKMHKQNPPDEPESPRPVTRDELKRSLARSGRFFPGRPPVHNE